MKRLLIANPTQFGYHTDTYFYCRYLKNDYRITYVCWDYGRDPVLEDGVTVIGVSRDGTKPVRLWRLLSAILQELRTGTYDIAFVIYFRFCSFLPLMWHRGTIILDIRTGYVRSSALFRLLYNAFLRVESLFFSEITIISDSLRRNLWFRKHEVHILPLGADLESLPSKEFKDLRLLYVGTFNYRHIARTVKGFDLFLTSTGSDTRAIYDIVGFGTEEEEAEIHRAIEQSRHAASIRFHGRVARNNLKSFLEKANVGVSFIPMLKKYDAQPATKTFEYLLAGMPVIATATKENQKVIDESNGVLIDDTAEGFRDGLKTLLSRIASLDSAKIKADSSKYSWQNIIHGNLRQYLESFFPAQLKNNTAEGDPRLLSGRLSRH